MKNVLLFVVVAGLVAGAMMATMYDTVDGYCTAETKGAGPQEYMQCMDTWENMCSDLEIDCPPMY